MRVMEVMMTILATAVMTLVTKILPISHPAAKKKNTKPSSNLTVSKPRRISKTRTINVSKNEDDDDDDASDDSDDDDSEDSNEDWNAGYEGNGPDCEFSLMVSGHAWTLNIINIIIFFF